MLHQKAYQPNVQSLKLTFWSDFSFSSKFLVAVSRLVWVCDNSFSSCCIFFSNASTSSLAFYDFFYRVIWRFMKMDGDKVGKKGKKKINKEIGQNNLQLEGLCLFPRVYRLRSWVFLALNRGRSPLRSSFFADRELPLRPRELVWGIGNIIFGEFGCLLYVLIHFERFVEIKGNRYFFCRVSKRSLKV